jgi:hypothetical protein
METQQIFEPEAQSVMGFAGRAQNDLQFPLSLAEKYTPRRIEDFIGVQRPKALFSSLLKTPRPASLLLVGPPGSGKTTMAMAFAEQLGGSLKHLAAQRCDVSTLETLRDQLAYSPVGGWWIVLIDECDGMTEKAQLQLLSWLDGTSALKPKFGGGFERGANPPVLYIFTCNGIGEKQTVPPFSLLPRFQSRCMTVEFEAATNADLAGFLEQVWTLEGGEPATAEYFSYMAKGVGVRDALMRLDSDLLAGPRPIPAMCATCSNPLASSDVEKCSACAPAPRSKPIPRHHTSDETAKARSAAANKAWATRRAGKAA